MEGRLFRPRERIARTWNLHLGCLRDKGPAITFIVGPQDTGAPSTFATSTHKSRQPCDHANQTPFDDAALVSENFALDPIIR